MLKKEKNIFVYVFFGLVLFILLNPLLTQPDKIIVFQAEDGIKNIFTYLYHSLYGNGLWFTGSNYPFGEHVTFTDNQPLLSVPFAYLREHGLVNSNWALGIFNALIPLSAFLGMIFIYKILRQYNISSVYSALISTLIIFMSPQWLRFNSGHFGLSYLHYFPMQFFWLKQYFETNKKKYVVYIGVLSVIMPFLHMYFVAFMLLWLGSFIISYLVITRKLDKNFFRFIYPLLLVCFITFILTYSFVKITDPITDRPSEPYGLLKMKYFTSVKDIFANSYTPFWQAAMRFFPESFRSNEGNCYTGILCIMIIFGTLGWKLRNKIKKQSLALPFQSGIQKIWIYTACLLLIFAMGVPFIWNMEFLLAYIPLLKQFRTFGRFSWGFYYITSIFCAVLFWQFIQYIKLKGRILLANTLLISGLVLWIFEATGPIKLIDKMLSNSHSRYKEIMGIDSANSLNRFLSQRKLSPENFQAILYLPFYHIGSEKILYFPHTKNGDPLTDVCAYSLQTGIPQIDVMLSRTSWSQTFDQVSWESGKWASKPCLRLLNQKNILVASDVSENLNEDELFILSQSDYLGIFKSTKLYSLNPEKLRKSIKKNQSYLLQKYSEIQNGIWKTDSLNHLIRINNIQMPDSNHISGFHYKQLNLSSRTINTQIVDSFDISKVFSDTNVEFSIWAQVPENNYRNPGFRIVEFDMNGKTLEELKIDGRTSNEVFKHKKSLWMLFNSYLKLNPATKSIKVELLNDEGKNSVFVKQLLFRQSNLLFLFKSNGQLFINNHMLPD